MVENWIGVAVVLLSILASHALLNRELRDMRKDMAALVERMAKLEGALDGFLAGFRAKGESDDGPQTGRAPTVRRWCREIWSG